MVLAPEHPLVDELVADGLARRRRPTRWTGGAATPARGGRGLPAPRPPPESELERQAEAREKTGVFIGAYAINPVNGEQIPVFIADYVLMGYGTGAIMAVPGQDQRDWDFAEAFGLPIVRTVQPPDGLGRRGLSLGDGPGASTAAFLDGLAIAEAKRAIIDVARGRRASASGTVTYKLRDWLFCRQRYWGEPFPIVYDEHGLPIARARDELPVLLPEIDDYSPRTFADDDDDVDPEPPLGRADGLGRGRARPRRRPEDVPPRAEHDAAVGRARAGTSCATSTRPTRTPSSTPRSSATGWARSRGRPGGVDLYVGGVEHAVLHLLYARFWHKVLFDLGHVSSSEPFRRLFNQGYIQAAAYTDDRGFYVEAERGRRARRRLLPRRHGRSRASSGRWARA